MSTPSLSEHLALVAADPSLVGHPVVAGLVVSVETLARELAELREENAELRRQLGRHSGNSGQPPSQDGPAAPPRTRRQRRSQGRAPGGQPGHAGTTRRQVAAAQVDRPVDHWPARCRGCGASLPRTAAGAPARRQVHDLPAPPPLAVTEHRAQAVCCPGCGTRTRAAFPADVAGPVQFGPRLEALAAYLRYAQHLPAARLRALLRELHGVSLSTASVEALCQRAAARLAAEAARQQAQALAVPVACMDETGLRVAGATLWLHVLGDETVTAYHLGAPRRHPGGVCGHGRTRPLRRLLARRPGGRDRPRPLQRPPAAQPGGDCRAGKGARRLGRPHAAVAARGPGPGRPLV